MSNESGPPKAYDRFIERYPTLGRAWDLIHEAGSEGPLDARTVRLVKLGIAMGAMREGQVHASVRKALRMGIAREEIEQVVALVPGTLGMPSTVANSCWVNDIIDRSE